MGWAVLSLGVNPHHRLSDVGGSHAFEWPDGVRKRKLCVGWLFVWICQTARHASHFSGVLQIHFQCVAKSERSMRDEAGACGSAKQVVPSVPVGDAAKLFGLRQCDALLQGLNPSFTVVQKCQLPSA